MKYVKIGVCTFLLLNRKHYLKEKLLEEKFFKIIFAHVDKLPRKNIYI